MMVQQIRQTQTELKQGSKNPDSQKTFGPREPQIKPNEKSPTELLDLPLNTISHTLKFVNDFKSLIHFSISSKECCRLFNELKKTVIDPSFVINASRSIPYVTRPRKNRLNLSLNSEEIRGEKGYEAQKKAFSALVKELNIDQRNLLVHSILDNIHTQNTFENSENPYHDECQEAERDQFLIEACAKQGINLSFQKNNTQTLDLIINTINWNGPNNTSTVNAFFSCIENLVINPTDSAEIKNIKEQLQHQLIIGIVEHEMPRGLIRTQKLTSQLDHYSLNYKLSHPNLTFFFLKHIGIKLNAKNSVGQTPEQYFLANNNNALAEKIQQLQAEIALNA
jgi:hypothetical protein